MAELIAERNFNVSMSTEISSKTSYLSHIRSYIYFCKIHKIDPEPTADTLSLYISWVGRHLSPNSLPGYLSGISHHLGPYYPGIHHARRTDLVKRSLVGVEKRFPKGTKRKDALTITQLQSIIVRAQEVCTCNIDSLLFVAMSLTGFFALMRLGELTYPDVVAHRSYRKIAMRTTVEFTAHSYGFTLPYHKADRLYKGSQILITSNAKPIDPLPHFMAYLTARDQCFPCQAELFLTSDGVVPTRTWFISKLQKLFPDTNISGHSFRAGGATWLAEGGISDSLIQKMGRWASNSFGIYIRKHPALLLDVIRATRHHSLQHSS